MRAAMRHSYLLLLLLFFQLSCAKSDDYTCCHATGDTASTHRDTGDSETTDTITIEWGDTTVADTMVKPWMPMVAQWPSRYDTWDGHFVLFADSLSPRVVELTLLSLRDWSKIMSANSDDHPTQAADTAARYVEYGLSGWSIPTETEARRMKSDLEVAVLNARLKVLGVDTIRTQSGSSNARYLCEEAAKTFSLADNTNITSAGSKTRYRLRLITTQQVARQ